MYTLAYKSQSNIPAVEQLDENYSGNLLLTIINEDNSTLEVEFEKTPLTTVWNLVPGSLFDIYGESSLHANLLNFKNYEATYYIYLSNTIYLNDNLAVRYANEISLSNNMKSIIITKV